MVSDWTVDKWPQLPFYYGYDIECYPNFFSLTIVHIYSGHRWIFEISPRVNHAAALYEFLCRLKHYNCKMVGFNNLGYDYPLLHHFIKLYEAQGYVTHDQLYAKSQQLINTPWDDRFSNVIWDNQQFVVQVDLMKIHHFDNKAKATSLKVLEFNMRSYTIATLPYDPRYPLTSEQMNNLIIYNCYDVSETIKFFFHTAEMIQFREKLSEKYNRNFLNHNDTKIGKDYFIMKLEEAMPGSCFDPQTRKARMTERPTIALGDVILPYIQFQTPEFSRVLEYLKRTSISKTKDAPELKDLNIVYRGFQFDIGSGGVHGSLKKRRFKSEGDYIIVDTDVASFYPNIGIKNHFFPFHLSETFCEIYLDLYNERSSYAKKTIENAMLKLALNGVYGDSNNAYPSPFKDPQYTMAITINGQMLLCMLAESVMRMSGIEMLQINTDGFTVRMHKECKPYYDQCCEEWQKMTGLVLEFKNYDEMLIRDVNSYFALIEGGEIKRVGAYQWKTDNPNNTSISRTWSQDWSALVCPRAAELAMTTGRSVEDLIWSHADPYDFMLRAKVNKSDKLMARADDGTMTQLQSTTRYYVAKSGPEMVKIAPPLAKSKTGEDRQFRIEKGWRVAICDDVRDWSWESLNRDYYIAETKKLLIDA